MEFVTLVLVATGCLCSGFAIGVLFTLMVR
jgi:hypothetical protein